MYALSQRQFGCLTQLDDSHVAEFQKMVNAWMDDWVPKFKDEFKPKCAFSYVEN
jgi:hypothetical protein